MNNHLHQDTYYDHTHSRSPGAHRYQPQTLHRQPSRHFDAYGQMPNNVYTPEEHNMRYEASRFDRMNTAGPSTGYNTYDGASLQPWPTNPFHGGQPLPSFGASGRMRPNPRQRSGIPPTWLDQQQGSATNPFGGIGPSPLGGQQGHLSVQQQVSLGGPQSQFGSQQMPMGVQQGLLRSEHFATEDEDLIPTAIVIKNIPFAVKKEQLTEVMAQMNLPLPYAFNYHFDNGVFRGLAFANFTSPEETAMVIEHLNHFELQGRKLRVEYKKMLPLQERERIEREKRERRGQLEEQHRPMTNLNNQQSVSSMSSHIPAASPSPISVRNEKPGVDLNDPQTLGFYSELLLFRDDHTREALIFPSALSPNQRRLVHTLAHHMGLSHISRGNGDQRQVHVFRAPHGSNISPPIPQVSAIHAGDASRRGLNRAATIDFNEARTTDVGIYNPARGQQSSAFLGVSEQPTGGLAPQQNLRAAKSFADLRSYTPSPVPSSASFPVALQSNIARYQDYVVGSTASSTATATPTASVSALGPHRDENLLVNGINGMSLGNGLGLSGPNGGSPRRQRGLFSWDQENQPTTGLIAGTRSFSLNNYEDPSRNGAQNLPLRQPRGPGAERGTGFSRGRQNGHQGRGSDELKPSVDIIVE